MGRTRTVCTRISRQKRQEVSFCRLVWIPFDNLSRSAFCLWATCLFLLLLFALAFDFGPTCDSTTSRLAEAQIADFIVEVFDEF